MSSKYYQKKRSRLFHYCLVFFFFFFFFFGGGGVLYKPVPLKQPDTSGGISTQPLSTKRKT